MADKVNTKEQIFDLIREHASDLKRLGARRLGLFGSFVRNTQTDSSDGDLLVEFDPGMKTFKSLSALLFRLEDIFGREVDLLTPEGLSPYVGRHIMREVEYATVDS
jgi:hypothetical protein